jgi:predicted RNase H-like HicB family nuclease
MIWRLFIMPDYFYKAVIESQSEGGFTAYVPGLPGCVSEGETYEEALANIREALELYLEVQRDRGGEIRPDPVHFTEMRVSL